MNDNLKRLLTFLVAASMVLSMMPMVALADNSEVLVPEESVGPRDPVGDETVPETSEPEETTEPGETTSPAQSEVVSFTADSVTMIEGTGYDDGGVCYYNWSAVATYTAVMSDGSVYHGPRGFEHNGQYYGVGYLDTQREASWQAGNTYPGTLQLLDGFGNVITTSETTVTVAETPIDYIVFGEVEVVKGVDSQEHFDDRGENGYSHYYWAEKLTWTVFLKGGDYIQGKGTNFTYNNVDYYMDYNDGQSWEHPWDAGNHAVTIRLMNVTAIVNVKVVETLIKDITVSPLIMMPHGNGYVNGEGTPYFHYSWYDGLEYQITFTDNTTYHGKGNEFWYKGEQYWLSFKDNQSGTNPWQAGNTYYGQISALGYTKDVPVVIEPSPVKSVSIQPVTLYENTNGTILTDHPDAGDPTQSYFHYEWRSGFHYEIEFADGSRESGNGSGVYHNGQYYSFHGIDNQSFANQWTVGNTYYPTTYFLGVTLTVPVTIARDPIADIVFEPVLIKEYTGGQWMDGPDGRYYWYTQWSNNLKFTVYYTDGRTQPGQGWGFDLNGEYVSFSTGAEQSAQNPWLAGNTYQAYVNVKGKIYYVPVTIYRETTSSGFTYLVQDNKAIIKSCSLYEETLQIPETIDGYPVVGILSLGYAINCVKTLVIPDSVTMLSGSVFHTDEWPGQIPLETLSIGAGVAELTVPMLYQAKDLQAITVAADNDTYCSVDGVVYTKDMRRMVVYPAGKQDTHVIPDSVEDVDIIFDNISLYGNISFQMGAGVKGYVMEDGIIYNEDKTRICLVTGELSGAYVMPDTITALAPLAFAQTGLTSVTVSKNVTSIAYGAFAGCTQLESVILPEGLEFIGASAFDGCEKLKRVDLPSTVKAVYESAYAGCKALAVVNTPSVEAWSAIVFENSLANPMTNSKNLYVAGQQVQDLVLPSVISKVYDYSFNYGKFRSITVPANVYQMGYCAFDGIQVETVHIRDLEKWCGIYFDGEESNPIHTGAAIAVNGQVVENLQIPETVLDIYDYAFYNANIKSATVPGTVYNIGYMSFAYADLTSIELGEGLGCIWYEAFRGADLESVTLPNSVMDVGSSTFRDCTKLKSVDLGTGIMVIWSNAFRNTALTSVTIPKQVERIGHNAFRDSKLETLDLQCTRVEIGDSAFMNCPLGDLELGENVVYLDWSAFRGIAATQVKLPGTVTYLSYREFGDCENLVSITLSEGIEQIDYGAFAGSDNLSHVLYTGTEEQWAEVCCDSPHINNAVIHFEATGDEVTTELTCAQIVYTCSICQKTMTAIRRTTAHNFDANGVCTICGHASLWEYVVDKTAGMVTVTGYSGKDTDLTIPSTIEGLPVKAIYRGAFAGRNIRSVVIPNSVEVLGEGVFKDCYNLQSVTLSKKLTEIPAEVFFGCRSLNNVKLPDSVTQIGASAFENCWRLSDITLNKGLTNIDNSAFYGCYDLQKVALPETVTQIGYYAFSCTQLTELTVPASVKTISPEAFGDCGALRNLYFLGDAPEMDWAFPYVYATIYFSANNRTWDDVNFASLGGSLTVEPCIAPWVMYQSESIQTQVGETVSAYVYGVGTDLRYQWYMAAPGSKRFEPIDDTDDSFSMTLTEGNSGSRVYCQMTDILGQTNRTTTITLKIVPTQTGIRVRRAPYTVEYSMNQQLRTNGLEVVKVFSDGSEELTEEYTYEGYNATVGGEQTITVTSGDYTATFTVTVNEEKINYSVTTDTEEKIEINVPENAVDSQAQLVVEKVELEEEEVEVVPEIIQQNESVVFDISFQKEEQVVQPSKAVEVSIPVPAHMESKRCKVFHVADDGHMEDMNAVYKDGHMVFDTEHFSYYAVVQMDGASVSGTVTGKDLFGVLVKLLCGDEVIETTTLDNGTYCFENLVENDYVIEVEKEDMKPLRFEITMEDVDKVLDILLAILGDVDGNTEINIDDVVSLLLHVSMPDLFQIEGEADFDGDADTDIDDVVTLLLHVSMPDIFPLD